ncbi:hypothetical protein OS493_032913 [Desmophyllum pertusum]|uniref:Uncharacterized protein n=1 Tax=Desmophyllum pertusum TaxID=174260 RepID=A0A9W9YKM7_9CNID|nr:hypothetical protein OS493_032913 [Desmophyllum pertusum]
MEASFDTSSAIEKRKRKRGQSDDYCRDISEPSRKSMRCLLKSDLPTDAINVAVPEVEKYKRKHSRNRAKRSRITQLADKAVSTVTETVESNVTADMTSSEGSIGVEDLNVAVTRPITCSDSSVPAP